MPRRPSRVRGRLRDGRRSPTIKLTFWGSRAVDWSQLKAGEDYYWDERAQQVVLRPPPDRREGVLDGERRVHYNLPLEIVARAKAAHFQRPMLLPGRGTPTPSPKGSRGLWPKLLAEQPPEETDGADGDG